ncbi:MAG: glycosyltransferase family 4 protein [Anaerolineales bacterium]|nr:glycosyltransferase family 4 protein [Anaerolineales bacterium]
MKNDNHKTIGIFHYQIGGTDGVSLEIEKWQYVLEKMGHIVHLCAGDLGGINGTLIEEMYHHRPDAIRLTYNTFSQLRDYPNQEAYKRELYSFAETIKARILAFIRDKGINFLVPQNIWSVGLNPSLAMALTQVMRELNLPTLAHSHDFYWERLEGRPLSCDVATAFADEYLPPKDTLASHVVINSLAQKAMLERKGIQAAVVPNVFDFIGGSDDVGYWRPDEYNRDLRAAIGLAENDIFILQATRLVERKGIELAVDFVRALNSPANRSIFQERGLFDGRKFSEHNRIVLVLAGYARDDANQYVKRLKTKIDRTGIDAIFIEEIVGARRERINGKKIYSLWDTYVYADLVTYPSLWEGWGNQLLEGLRARKPIMLFEYPVFQEDIKDKGFNVISLGTKIKEHDDLGLVRIHEERMEKAADLAVECLTNYNWRQDMVERNFQIGSQHYSLASLVKYLEPLIDR